MNVTSNIMCEHPQVLLHPHFWQMLDTYGRFYINNVLVATRDDNNYREYDLHKYYPKKNGVTPDNYRNSYFLNPNTGEAAYAYFVVPCGKCLLCRNKKANELAARCVAETNRWNSTPLFLTLTYNDEHLPLEGLRKIDVQWFLKRLRSRLDYYKIEHNLRYLYVGEYGSKYGRPHYHMLIWNFPQSDYFPNMLSIQKFIQRCWSLYVETPEGKRIPTGHRFPNGRMIYKTEYIGYVKTLPVKNGAVSYVTKYMRKGTQRPAGKTPGFMCASNRGGGIGSAYFRSFAHDFWNHPTILNLPVVDKVVSGRTFWCPITPYIKNLLAPSLSTSMKKKDYTICKSFFNYLRLFKAVCNAVEAKTRCKMYSCEVTSRKPDYEKTTLPLEGGGGGGRSVHHDWYWKQEFQIEYYYNNPKILAAIKKLSFMKQPLPTEEQYQFYFCRHLDEVMEYYYRYKDLLEDLTQKVLDLEVDDSYICRRDNMLKFRSDALSDLFANAKPKDIESRLEQLKNALSRSLVKEIF